MKTLYASPLRVYLGLGLLACMGLWMGSQLPVSLFPNSSKPVVGISIPLGNQTAEEFRSSSGNALTAQLKAMSSDEVELEKIDAHYSQTDLYFYLSFKWGSPPKIALEETRRILHSFAAQLPSETRQLALAWPMDQNSGFFLSVFSSPHLGLDELYSLLEPLLVPSLVGLPDVGRAKLYNPFEKEIQILLKPEALAAFQLFPRDVATALQQAFTAHNGGYTTVGHDTFGIQIPKQWKTFAQLPHLPLVTPGKQHLSIGDVAEVAFERKTQNAWSYKISGQPGLILYIRPKPGGNIRQMSADVQKKIQHLLPSLPPSLQHQVIVDPAEFIESAVANVFHEVALGALLAVLILFVFVGSLKNTITAAIEIPLSMVLAFIPMKLSGMSLNLISLGGLALSAGMNVDASVVVMENIFRHFQLHPAGDPLSQKGALRLVVKAVREVRWPVISSTLASLVVFLPLAFTSELAYAVLGDLAKTVVFSHGFSALVALVLVPTVRLHLFSRQLGSGKVQDTQHSSPFEPLLLQLEQQYLRALTFFLDYRLFQKISYLVILVALTIALVVVAPRLPKEVIGKPDTDRLFVNIQASGHSDLSQMEALVQETETRVIQRFSDRIAYATQESWGSSNGGLLIRLKHKADMPTLWKELEAELRNTSSIRYQVDAWNPGELPLPHPPFLEVSLRGGDTIDRAFLMHSLFLFLEERQAFPRLNTTPSFNPRQEEIVLSQRFQQTNLLPPQDLADLVRTLTTGKRIGEISLEGSLRDIFLKRLSPLPEASGKMTLEEIQALPLGVAGKIIPLKALYEVKLQKALPPLHLEEDREVCLIQGFPNETDPLPLSEQRLEQAKRWIQEWKTQQLPLFEHSPLRHRPEIPLPAITLEEARKDIHTAIHQLSIAVLLSIGLIFLILLLQFSHLVEALIILVAVPLGILGALLSLFLFRSNLSLNSILGMILLNGIAVANSILLIDFFKHRIAMGLSPLQAALEAGQKRLRPILITSLTTILGMIPVALGLGEGGKILQPLGIAVSGGLWISMGLTLFLVPSLQVAWTEWKQQRNT